MKLRHPWEPHNGETPRQGSLRTVLSASSARVGSDGTAALYGLAPQRAGANSSAMNACVKLMTLVPALALVACATARMEPAVPENGVSSRFASTLQDSLTAILRAGIRDSAFPGAVAVAGTKDGVAVMAAAGMLDWQPSPAPTMSTLWDLASLTKVVGLTSAMMLLVESGRVDLSAPVQRYIPEFTGRGKEAVTVRHLLTHAGGLPAWRPLYKESESPQAALALAIATPLDTMPGIRMVYSDLGAIILGEVVARATGQSFETFLRQQVLEPLGMRETMFRPPESLRGRIAPTEIDPWRQRHLRGEVHDENAFALGGVSSHAGLFGTANDLVRLARMFLDGGALDGRRFLATSTIDLFTSVQDSTLSHRALGWETPNGSNSAGRQMSKRSFGHTGFTGTSFWVDRERGVFVILLSNRVNPTREHRGITGVRTAVADAVIGAVLR
jgi:CubicO group peptidase (beta-lactamase class C family)